MLNVVKASHIGNVWYWEGVYHLLRDTNYSMQFWCYLESVFPYLILFPLYNLFVCVFNKKEKKRKILCVV